MSYSACDPIRMMLLKLVLSLEGIGALIRVTVRKVWVSLSESCPYQALFRRVYENLALSREGLVRVCPTPLRC